MEKRSLGTRIKQFFANTANSPLSSLWGWVYPQTWGGKQFLEQFQRYVFVAVSAIAQDAARINFEVNKVFKEDSKPATNHPFLTLMKKPNPMQSQFQFLEMHFAYMKICGESFWYLIKGERSQKPKEIYLLKPHQMVVIIDSKDNRGLVTGYALLKEDGTKVEFTAEEIVHFKMPNPSNPYRGYGVVEAARVYVQTEEFASTWTMNAFFNAGRPSGILNLKGVVDKEQWEKLERQFNQKFTGSKNAGKTMITKGFDGLDYQKLGMEMGEVALKELKDMVRDDIMVMFRVSKTILGITDDVNRANAHESRIVFVENVIRPEQDRFIDHLNAFLIPLWGEGFVLDYESLPLVSPKERVEEWTAGHNKWLTINDIRVERGLEPLEGGDVIREPITMLPSTLPPEARGLTSKKKELDRKVAGEIFRQILFRNQEAWSRKFREEINNEFTTQKKEILERHSNKKLTKKTFEDWLFSLPQSKARLLASLVPILYTLILEQSRLALDTAGDLDTQFLLDERIKNLVLLRISKLADETNDQTIEMISSTLTEGFLAGDSIKELMRRIELVYGEAISTRSERIARTETIWTSNEAANEAYLQSPVVTHKEWHAEPNACEFCGELDGKIVGKSETFLSLGQTFEGSDEGKFNINYTDIVHPPLHPNCRCAILPVRQ